MAISILVVYLLSRQIIYNTGKLKLSNFVHSLMLIGLQWIAASLVHQWSSSISVEQVLAQQLRTGKHGLTIFSAAVPVHHSVMLLACLVHLVADLCFESVSVLNTKAVVFNSKLKNIMCQYEF